MADTLVSALSFYPPNHPPPLCTTRYAFVGAVDPVAVPNIIALPYGGRLKF